MAHFSHGDRQEEHLIRLFNDLARFNDNMVIVGGWLPYLYTRYLWKIPEQPYLVKTTDIDIAVHKPLSKYDYTVAEILVDKPGYSIDPVYEGEDMPYDIWTGTDHDDEGKMRIDFLIDEYEDINYMQKIFLGKGVNCIPLETVDFMLDRQLWAEIKVETENSEVPVKILMPSAYFFIKGISFSMRTEESYKYLKDMWSMFFILEYIPETLTQDFYSDLDKHCQHKHYGTAFIKAICSYFLAPPQKGIADLTGFLKTIYPEKMIRTRIEKRFSNLMDLPNIKNRK